MLSTHKRKPQTIALFFLERGGKETERQHLSEKKLPQIPGSTNGQRHVFPDSSSFELHSKTDGKNNGGGIYFWLRQEQMSKINVVTADQSHCQGGCNGNEATRETKRARQITIFILGWCEPPSPLLRPFARSLGSGKWSSWLLR